MNSNDVVIREFEHEIDAEIAKGHLADAGIVAMIAKDDGGGMIPSLQNADGVQLIVPLHQAAAARSVLGTKNEE
ncbi:MAG: putative signal transducing protein [Bacteroidota bacterium]